MHSPHRAFKDGNEAVASVAYRLSETIAIYPITPSSSMAELADEWSTERKPNLWGAVPEVMEMQSEGGAAGTVHGALQAGALTTTFTASQGLLLMIPNMYKIAGELTPFCMHVSARTLATHALSIFGDHQDVMACRQTGFAMVASNSVQEAHDLAAIAHAATLRSRVPFLHFFDGFRTSHEVNTLDPLHDDDLRALVDDSEVNAFRCRAMTPDRPTIRGTAQNPDVFFQAREACNLWYDRTPAIVQETMDRFAAITGRAYQLVEYQGSPEADRVVVAMGSGCETISETVDHLNAAGAKVGLVKVRLYRPFPMKEFLACLPRTVRAIAVLDRTKEPGALGDPLFLDVRAALADGREWGLVPEDWNPRVSGGRYGLSSKEFTPSMVKAVFDSLSADKPQARFTVGIKDDVTGLSLDYDPEFDIEGDSVQRAVFYGLGSDGTVGANKNTVKIIGEETGKYAQAYFVYDSKKSGAITTSHLRFSDNPIRAPYLIRQAQFVGCHQFSLLEKYDVLGLAAPGGVFLVNMPFPASTAWNHFPAEVQETIMAKKLRCYVIDAYAVAREAGMGGRINTIMQTCYFAISGVLPRDEAIAQIKRSIEKTYGRKGEAVVRQNWEAVDRTLENLHQIQTPDAVTATFSRPAVVAPNAPDFVQRVTAVILANEGDRLPVSAFSADGTWPTDTARWEKRSIAQFIPEWDSTLCIQCNKCVFVCPHAAIRAKFYPEAALAGAPETFRSTAFRSRENPGHLYTLQVAAEDCTGCELCVAVCPAKDKKSPKRKAINMIPQEPVRAAERDNYEFFLGLPEPDPAKLENSVKGSQFRQPLFEFSGACAGCGETPYIKLLTQLYGDRLFVANATGCSSIYGGNLPTTPYAQTLEGRGPAWSNSLFEDNAEYGLGMRLALDHRSAMARDLVRQMAGPIGPDLAEALAAPEDASDEGVAAQRARVARLREVLKGLDDPKARRLETLADDLVAKSVWIVGGDGWAYDIGFGGLDHVLATGRKVNLLVLDTGVYSNTGGQQSKATPMGAVAKFATGGKAMPKKDLGLIAMMYGHVYVAQIAFGAKDAQTLQAFREAEAHPGPSLIIAYSHCIAHGYNMNCGLDQQKLATETGIFPLFRFDPSRTESGQPALRMDSGAPSKPLSAYLDNEARFRMLQISDPDRSRALAEASQAYLKEHYELYARLASKPQADNGSTPAP